MPNPSQPKNLQLSELTSVTPLDGRYRNRTGKLSEMVSEYGLIKIRIEVEIKYLLALSNEGVIRKFTSSEKEFLSGVYDNFTVENAKEVKRLEQETRHDVKAMEHTFRALLKNNSLSDVTEMIHFGLTSWDVNNIAYNLQLMRPTQTVIIPAVAEIVNKLVDLADANKSVAMLARTHGQPAVPTTLGKEIAVFAVRLNRELNKLMTQKLTGKLNGAVGNYNALMSAYPNVDWVKFSEKFIASLGLEPNLFTTQINPYDDVAEYMQILMRINNIIIGLDQDFWHYISDNWFIQEVKAGEVGSSTMPQKVNPIDFENSEGNMGLANALFEFMARKLPVSRLQRDLTDSTVVRNYGTALSYSLIGYESLTAGLLRVKPNLEKIELDLNEDYSILTEGVQTILRKAGVDDSYTLIKNLVRGKHIGEKEWKAWIKSLPVEQKYKDELSNLTPSNYIGLATNLTEKAVKEIRK